MARKDYFVAFENWSSALPKFPLENVQTAGRKTAWEEMSNVRPHALSLLNADYIIKARFWHAT
jgi:hypothetical protein